MLEVRNNLKNIKVIPGWNKPGFKPQGKSLHVDGGAEALLIIKEYLDHKNMSVFKLFREFDEDNSDTLDYSEFVQGIQVIYFAMNTIFEAKCTGLCCIFEISIMSIFCIAHIFCLFIHLM